MFPCAGWFAIPMGRITGCVIWSWEDSIQPTVCEVIEGEGAFVEHVSTVRVVTYLSKVTFTGHWVR